MSFIQDVAKRVVHYQKANKGDEIGYGPNQMRASSDGWFYKSKGHGTWGFVSKEHGDLELEVLKVSMENTQKTLREYLGQSGADQHVAKSQFMDRIKESKLEDTGLQH